MEVTLIVVSFERKCSNYVVTGVCMSLMNMGAFVSLWIFLYGLFLNLKDPTSHQLSFLSLSLSRHGIRNLSQGLSHDIVCLIHTLLCTTVPDHDVVESPAVVGRGFD